MRLMRDGVEISRHTSAVEAMERAGNEGPGRYTLVRPDAAIVVDGEPPIAEPDPDPVPDPDPDPAPDPDPPTEPPYDGPTTPPADFAIFDDGQNGVTWTHFNKVGNLDWRIPGGTWMDAEGVPQGDVPVSSGVVDIRAYPAWVEVDVIPFMERWQSLNDGLFLRSVGGKANYRTREYSNVGQRPYLVVTTERGKFTCPCIGDVDMSDTTSYGMGKEPNAQYGAGLIRFDISGVDGTPTSATMWLYTYKVYGATHELHCYYVDAPRPFDVGQTPRLGIAAETDDLAAHPSVFAAFDWSGDWRTDGRAGSTKEDANCVSQEFPDGQWWLKISMPTDSSCSGGGEGTGFSRAIPLAPLPESIDPIPQEPLGPTHAFFRYSVMLDPDWTSLDDRQLIGGKFPGLSGRFGYIRSAGGGYWQPTAANGGSIGEGKYYPVSQWNRYASFKGWSARMQWAASALGQHTNPMRDTTGVGSYLYHPGWRNHGTGQIIMWPNCQLEVGREYDIEQEVKINTITGPYDEYGNGVGQADGIFRAWMNGVLVYEDTQFIFTHHPAIAIQDAWLVFKNGGTLSPCLPHHVYLGPVVIASEYIGPRSDIQQVPPTKPPPIGGDLSGTELQRKFSALAHGEWATALGSESFAGVWSYKAYRSSQSDFWNPVAVWNPAQSRMYGVLDRTSGAHTEESTVILYYDAPGDYWGNVEIPQLGGDFGSPHVYGRWAFDIGRQKLYRRAQGNVWVLDLASHDWQNTGPRNSQWGDGIAMHEGTGDLMYMDDAGTVYGWDPDTDAVRTIGSNPSATRRHSHGHYNATRNEVCFAFGDGGDVLTLVSEQGEVRAVNVPPEVRSGAKAAETFTFYDPVTGNYLVYTAGATGSRKLWEFDPEGDRWAMALDVGASDMAFPGYNGHLIAPVPELDGIIWLHRDDRSNNKHQRFYKHASVLEAL